MFSAFRHRAQWLALGGLLTVSGWVHAAEPAPDGLRIGYQKGSVSMVLAKSHELLEKRYPNTKISSGGIPGWPANAGGAQRQH